MHLLERKSERKEALCLIAGETSRQAFAPERGDFGGVDVKRRFDGIERRRTGARPQRSPASTEVAGEGAPDLRQWRFEPRHEGLG